MKVMRTMTKPLSLLSALALVALVIPIGCHDDQGPSVNSETHFLKSCADGCGPDLECICGVCSRVCSTNDECTDLNRNAECTLACADAPSPMMCDLPCSADADCAALDPHLVCTAGVCRPEPPGTTGAGGDRGGNGGSGAGGNGGGSADTPMAFCNSLMDLYVDFFSRCTGASAESWRLFLPPPFVCGNAAEAVQNGRLTFSGSDAQA